MRISDWSSDVCSSDLGNGGNTGNERQQGRAAMNEIRHWKNLPGNRHRAARLGQRDISHRHPGLRRGDGIYVREGGPVLGGSGEAMPGAKPSEGTATGASSATIGAAARTGRSGMIGAPARSEEHTSELQPLMRTSYAVF